MPYGVSRSRAAANSVEFVNIAKSLSTQYSGILDVVEAGTRYLEEDLTASIVIQENRGSLYDKINQEMSYFDNQRSAAVLNPTTLPQASMENCRQFKAEYVPEKSEFRAYLNSMDTKHSLSPEKTRARSQLRMHYKTQGTVPKFGYVKERDFSSSQKSLSLQESLAQLEKASSASGSAKQEGVEIQIRSKRVTKEKEDKAVQNQLRQPAREKIWANVYQPYESSANMKHVKKL